MMALLLAAIACTGTEAIVRSHPLVREAEAEAPADRLHTYVTWTLPGLTALLAAVLISQAPAFLAALSAALHIPEAPVWAYRVSAYVLTGLVLVLVVSAEYYTIDRTHRLYGVARFLLNAWAYVLALALFLLIYFTKTRSLVSATEVTVVGAFLALEFLRSAGQPFGRTALYAGIAGLCTGEIIWALNYMRIGWKTGGFLLLLGFYLATGLANQQLQGRLSRRVLAEYGAVALVGLFVLLQFGP